MQVRFVTRIGQSWVESMTGVPRVGEHITRDNDDPLLVMAVRWHESITGVYEPIVRVERAHRPPAVDGDGHDCIAMDCRRYLP